MQQKTSRKLFLITVVLESGKTRSVNVRASSRDVAERRALKRVPGAVNVQSGDK